MKKPLIFVLALTLLVLINQPAKACEACFKILTLEETAEAADLVIIGKLVKEGPSTGDYPHGGPDWIEIQVLETLKGEAKAKKIKVNSWDGMCAYGIILSDKREHLIFLAEGEDLYRAVEIGCSARQFPVEDGIVKLEEESVALDALVLRLGLEREVVTINSDVVGEDTDSAEKDGGVLPVCGLAGMGVIVVGMVVWVGRRRE